MRELKFRAWIPDLKVIGQVVMTESTNSDYKIHAVTVECFPGGRQLFHKAFNFELMQYTGLKDKNGKEVYESDIVNVEDLEFEGFFDSGVPDEPYERYSDCKCKVVYMDGAFFFEGASMGEVPLHAIEAGTFEVIGNIYENPELYETLQQAGRR